MTNSDKIFKVTAEGDQLFFGAETEIEAKQKFADMMGSVPASLLTWEEVAELPEGEELL